MIPRARAIELAGVGVMLACILVRVTSSHDVFPGWIDDPIAMPTIISGVTPAWSLVIDALIMLASALSLFGAALAGRETPWKLAALGAIGCIGVGVHAAGRRGVMLDDLTHGASWCAGIFAAIAGCSASSNLTARRLLAAGLLGVAGMIAAKSVSQVFLEHGATVADYLANKDAILNAKSWSVDSPMTRNFERRLMQNEATGWLGLSNILATFGVAALIAGMGLTFRTARRKPALRAPTPTTPAPAAAPSTFSSAALSLALTGALLLALAKSKGGYVAAAFGLFALFLPTLLAKLAGIPSGAGWLARRASVKLWIGRGLGLAAIALPLLLVAVRGAIGERISELSLLFRWFYVSTAVKVFASNPWTGVGPDGFQAAYVFHKPSISPEAVTSPHSVLLDWLSTLGIFGVAWCALVVAFAWSIGTALMSSIATARVSPPPTREGESLITPPVEDQSEDEPQDFTLRTEVRLLAAACAAALLGAATLEAPGASYQSTIIRILGAALFLVCGGGVIAASRKSPGALTVALCGAALAALAHGQIEMTPVNGGSCAWWLALVGVAAGSQSRLGTTTLRVVSENGGASHDPHHAERGGTHRRWLRYAACIPPLLAGLGTMLLLSPVIPWEVRVRRSVDAARPLAEVTAGVRALSEGKLPRDVLIEIQKEITQTLTTLGYLQGQPDAAKMDAAIARLREDRLIQCATELEVAHESIPTHFGTARALSRVYLERAELLAKAGKSKEAVEVLDRGYGIAATFGATTPGNGRPSVWAWFGMYSKARAEMLGRSDILMRGALLAFEEAARLDPGNAAYPVEAAELAVLRGDSESAAAFAREALRRDSNTRLDPLMGLGETRRSRMEALAGKR